jgi:glycosyltransferase involved in cell wall biosynthesis
MNSRLAVGNSCVPVGSNGTHYRHIFLGSQRKFAVQIARIALIVNRGLKEPDIRLEHFPPPGNAGLFQGRSRMNLGTFRILHLNSLLTGGGTDDQCVKLAHGLARLGHRVWLAGPDGREFSRVARALDLPFHPTPPEGPAKLRFILSAARLIRRERVQIVHGHHGRDLWPTILAGRLSGVRPKVVLTRHMAKSPSSWPSRRFLLNRCDALIAVSEFVARVLREGVYEPDSSEPERRARRPLQGDLSRIRVAWCGIDTERFRPGAAEGQRRAWGVEPEHFVFAVAGGYYLPRGKGQREFLQAAARIHAAVPQARFLIIGRGDMAALLQADIDRLGLAGKAWLTPYCSDMAVAMNAIDCLVHPQVGTEAFGLVVCEAHACGRPVIASALDGIPEAFQCGGEGQLVPPEDVNALAEAMRVQIGRPVLGEAQRREVHERVAAALSLPAAARRVEAIYRRLLEGGSPV